MTELYSDEKATNLIERWSPRLINIQRIINGQEITIAKLEKEQYGSEFKIWCLSNGGYCEELNTVVHGGPELLPMHLDDIKEQAETKKAE